MKPAGGGGSGRLHYGVPAREEDLPELSRDVGGGYIRADQSQEYSFHAYWVPAYSFLFYCAVQNEQCCHAKNHARAPRFQYLAHSPYAPRTKYGHGEHLGIMPASWRQMFFGCVEKFGRLSRRSLALCVKGLLARPHDRRRLRTNQKSTAMPLRSQSP